MVTARVAIENRLQSFRTGAEQYVPKPYTPDQIFDAIADAESCARQAEHPPRDGEIPFESDGEGETLRRLGRLRDTLLATTPLGPDEAARIVRALGGLWDSADSWGRANRVGRVASLHYHVYPDCAVLTLNDDAGWFRDDARPAAERWQEAIAAGGFDEVEDEGTGGPVVMVVRFESDATPGQPPPP
jgi:hypothetical protein